PPRNVARASRTKSPTRSFIAVSRFSLIDLRSPARPAGGSRDIAAGQESLDGRVVAAQDLVGRAERLEAPLDENRHAVGDRTGQLDVVGDHHRRVAHATAQLSDQV